MTRREPIDYVRLLIHHSSPSLSTSFPLPFINNGKGGGTLVDVSRDGPVGLVDEPDNCHDGIDGRGGKEGKGGADVDALGVRLNSSVFKDLRSCCSSPNDCV